MKPEEKERSHAVCIPYLSLSLFPHDAGALPSGTPSVETGGNAGHQRAVSAGRRIALRWRSALADGADVFRRLADGALEVPKRAERSAAHRRGAGISGSAGSAAQRLAALMEDGVLRRHHVLSAGAGIFCAAGRGILCRCPAWRDLGGAELAQLFPVHAVLSPSDPGAGGVLP